MSQEPAIRFVLYSEDRADANEDFAVLRQVLLGMLRRVCAGVKTNHVRIEPVQPVREGRICGSYWKEHAAKPGAQQHRRELIRDVVTALLRGRVVFFHVDADAVYSARERCEHLRSHWPRFQRDVRSVLAGVGDDSLDEVLILAMPFYEMESWAFANVEYLRRVLRDPREAASLSRWEHDLRALDEIADIKDLIALSASQRREIVLEGHGFPVQALEKADQSYARTIERLRGSQVVMRGLAEAAARAF